MYLRAWIGHGLLSQGLALAMKLNDHNFEGDEKLREWANGEEGKGQGKRSNRNLGRLL